MTVSRETAEELLEALKSLIIEENGRQNLIAASTIATFDERHLADSLQLVPYLRQGTLLDVGSGGGFPGLVLACVVPWPIHLVEPRGRRAGFLLEAVQQLGLQHVSVHASRVERLTLGPVETITARAVAGLADLLAMTAHLADRQTRWVLPKGRSAASELEEARQTWQGEFRLVQSMTDANASIVIAEDVRRRSAR